MPFLELGVNKLLRYWVTGLLCHRVIESDLILQSVFQTYLESSVPMTGWFSSCLTTETQP